MGWFTVFRSRRMAVLFLLGFSSGLPLMLTGQTVQAWLTAEHVSLERIGAVSLVGLAYTLKFAWAPLLDRFRLPFLGRRRGWVLAAALYPLLAFTVAADVQYHRALHFGRALHAPSRAAPRACSAADRGA